MVSNYGYNPFPSNQQPPHFSATPSHSSTQQSQSTHSSSHVPLQNTEQQRDQRYWRSITNLINCGLIKDQAVANYFHGSIVRSGDPNRVDALYRTIFSIHSFLHSQVMENDRVLFMPKAVYKDNMGKVVTQYSYIISKDQSGKWNLVIATDFIAKGTFKKFNRSVDLTAGEYRSRGTVTDHKDKNAELANLSIEEFRSELEMHNDLRRTNPDIYDHHIHLVTTYTGKAGQQKLIFLDKDIIGDAGKIMNSSPRQVLTAAICMCRGLAQMEADGYVHGDMKWENLFIETSEDLKEGIVKLGDVGGAKKIGQLMNTATYMAPEWIALIPENNVFDIRKIPADPKYDSFCAGVAILHFIVSFSPQPQALADFISENMAFMDQKNMQTYILEIVDWIKSSVTDELGGEIFDRMADIAMQLTEKNPEDRISCAEAFRMLQDLQLDIAIKIDVDSSSIQDSF